MHKGPFSFEHPQQSPGFLLWQTTIIWQRRVKKALDLFDLSHAQFVLLALLLWLNDHAQRATQIELATWSKLDKMTVSKALKKLAVNNLVKRAEHATDTRAKQVTLTKNGKKIILQVMPLIEQIDEEFFGILSKSQQTALAPILNTLAHHED